MKVKIEAIKNFSSSVLGSVTVPLTGPAPTFTIEKSLADKFVGAGLCKHVSEKTDPKHPGASGQAKPSVASPADQALQSSNANTPEESAESSQSTTTTSEPRGVTQSTPQTEHGGSDTTSKSRKNQKGSRKTNG